MKVIDLLNKIANGEELPKKIKYNNITWVYNISYIDYAHPSGAFITFFSTSVFDNGKPTNDILNDEIEIIEEIEPIEDEFIDIEEIKLERDDILGYYNGASHRMTTNVKDREVYIKIINNLIKNQKKIIERVDK